MRRKLILIGLFALTLKLLIAFSPVWERYPGGLWNVLIFLFIVFLLLWLVIGLLKEIYGLIKNRKTLTLVSFAPTVLILAAYLFISYTPDMEDTLYGKVIFRACYEGTQNQSTFKLRENNRFEIHSTGVFFYDNYSIGQYTQRGDTLYLTYNSDKNRKSYDKVYMDNNQEILIPIIKNADSTRRQLTYYYGYCKGLN